MIEAMLLGTGAMMPLPHRWLSSLLVRSSGQMTLFDCGEGTQIAWRSAGWGMRRLGAICLSHCHADHVAGLPGLLHALTWADRDELVTIYGPAGTLRVVEGLRVIAPMLPYPVAVRELAPGDVFALPGGLTGTVAAGHHALPVLAYRVDLPRAPRFELERARALGVPLELWRRLQAGEMVTWARRSAQPEQVMGPPRRGVSLAYVTDTRPVPGFLPLLEAVDLLVCEGTYGDSADTEKAARNTHMTFAEAAGLAAAAKVGRLWLTHFSPGMADPGAFAANARAIFPETTVGYAGLTTDLTFPDPG